MVGNETVKIFDGAYLMLVVEEIESRRVFRWDTQEAGRWPRRRSPRHAARQS
jgi:hypothetical protein